VATQLETLRSGVVNFATQAQLFVEAKKGILGEIMEREKLLFRTVLGLSIFHLLLIIFLSPDQLLNDEPRYFSGANNLTKGYFVEEKLPDFTNGPGYPMLLAPVMGLLGFEFDRMIQDPDTFEFYVPGESGEPLKNLKWRLLPLRLLNIPFLAIGYLAIYFASKLLIPSRWALAVMLAMALNPFQLRWVPMIMTENVTPMLFGLFAWAYIKGLQAKSFSWKLVILAGLAFAWLAMTRTMFGYVALGALLSAPVLCLIDGYREKLKAATIPFVAALIFCIPYLSYTHHHTGKVFCWATNGTELLYWITSPHEGEYGSWLQEKWVKGDPLLAENHLSFIQSASELPPIEREERWMEGVKKHLESEGVEKALVRNYAANLCRVFFNVPRSRKFENFPKLVWALTGFVVFLGMAGATIVTLWKWRDVHMAIKLLLLCFGIYFCGVLLLPAEPRYLIPVFPAIFLWIAYVLSQLVEVRVSFRPVT
tara:strand:+ start:12650 stop:14089 length:1440 start_codon:yes stop_codon:yes gene_type:complete